MVRPLRRLPFPFLLLPLALVLLLAACEQSAGPNGLEAETVSVTLAPSFAKKGLSTQGIPGDLVVSDVGVLVRDSRPLDDGGVGCFVVSSDGAAEPTGSQAAQECEVSIWDGLAVVPTTLQLPVRDDAGATIPYEFLLNVRSGSANDGLGSSTAFASENLDALADGATVTFDDVNTYLLRAQLFTWDPLVVDPASCQTTQIADVEPGERVSLYLAAQARGTGSEKCFEGQSRTTPFVPFPDFGVGAASVLLDGVDITAQALPFSPSKRGMQVQVPPEATPGATLEVSLTASGVIATRSILDTMFVTAITPTISTATLSLQVVEPPVGAGLDVDLTAPEILSDNFDNLVTQVSFGVGPSDDPADLDSVVGFVGPRPLVLQFVQSFDSGPAGEVAWTALVCNDFSAIAPIAGFVTTLDATFYAIDPDGNQSAPYTAPITVTSSYQEPSGACSTTVPW